MNFKDATFIRDLIYYDGPLVSLYYYNNQAYLVYWLDLLTDHVWNIISVESEDLGLYLTKKLSILDLQKKAEELYICTGPLDENEFEPMEFEALPDDWQAPATSYFDEDLHP